MDYRIKDLPQSERPREKLQQNGVKSLTDVELLSLLLRTGTSGKNVKELSAEILNSYSLPNIAERSVEDLKNFDGVSKVKAGQLKAISELALRMQNQEKEKIESFSDIKDRLQDMKFLETEKARLFLLSSGNHLLHEEEFDGDVGSVAIKPQKVFRLGIKHNAAAAILAHNHPSGKAEPTKADIETTEELVDLGRKLDVELLDHIIVGKKIESMRRSSGIKF